MSAPAILVLSGSARAGSLNTALATLAARKLEQAGAQVRQISLADYPLPFVDESHRGHPTAEAKALGALVGEHAGLFIACPEYNAGYTPALKNALDWISLARPGGPALAGKVVALGGASPSPRGAYRSLTQFRTVLELGFGALVIPETVSVPHADKAFGEDGEFLAEANAKLLDAAVARLLKLAGQAA
jgi:NAD(P)H-dependent FMN reductase